MIPTTELVVRSEAAYQAPTTTLAFTCSTDCNTSDATLVALKNDLKPGVKPKPFWRGLPHLRRRKSCP